MGGTCNTHGEEKYIQNFSWKPQVMRSVHKWENNIKIDICETECNVVDWIQPTLKSIVMNIQVP
jgi:hypothetical protein